MQYSHVASLSPQLSRLLVLADIGKQYSHILRIYLVFALLTDNPRIKIAPGLDRPLLNNPSF
jgi:hypothetical protein